MTINMNDIPTNSAADDDVSVFQFIDPAPAEVEDEPENDEWMHGDVDPNGCWNCDGNPSWCSFCGEWTRTCCEDYGTCACS